MAATNYENEASGSSAERVHAGLTLPVFDSLPATAGLSNLEAFQLSLKHALALLPQMLTIRYGTTRADGPERFHLR